MARVAASMAAAEDFTSRFKRVPLLPAVQGLTLVHFSAQLELCLTQENTLHTLNTP
jgi:hypothetical protein